MTKMAAMPIYGKKLFKNLLHWNRRADFHETSVPDPRGGGGAEGHVPPPPPKRPKVPLKNNQKTFFHVLLKEKVGKEGAQIEL